MSSDKKTARIAGLLYLLVAVFAGFAQATRINIITPGDAAATFQHISASGMLFRLTIVSDLVGQFAHVFLVLVLYALFRAVDKKQAFWMAVLALLPVPIAMLNQLNLFAVLQLTGAAGVSSAMDPASQALFYLGLFKFGVAIAAIFWGLWLFPLAYLVIKSGFLPKFVGILLLISGAGYVVDSFAQILLADYKLGIAAYTFFGEVVFLLWLLIMGVKTQPGNTAPAKA